MLMATPPYGITGGNPVQPAPKPTTTTTTMATNYVQPGLMGAAKAPATNLKPATAQSATYNPTGYNAQKATSTGYTATTGTAATYDPTKVNRAGTTYDPTKIDRTGTTYDPTLQDVQGNQLVSNQLTDLTGGNSKYIAQARQSAREQAARSGLMTSSIAAGNAERAAIQAALPIAQQDASRYGSVADQNMAASNQAGQFNASQNLSAATTDANAANTASQFNAGQNLSASTTDANAANQAGQFNAGSQNQMTQANMDATNRASEFGANASNTVSQFNANSANQAGAFNAQAGNEAGQFNVGQLNAGAQFNASQDNAFRQAQQQLAADLYKSDRATNATQANQYFGSQFQREQQLSQILQSIYNNPELTPAQQQQAANNAKVIMQGLFAATDATFAQGIPQIFLNV